MDYRRTCFIERWHFGQADDTASQVVWYEAPPGAQVYEAETPFRSLDWIDASDPIPSGPGPDCKRQLRYYDGAAPSRVYWSVAMRRSGDLGVGQRRHEQSGP